MVEELKRRVGKSLELGVLSRYFTISCCSFFHIILFLILERGEGREKERMRDMEVREKQ